MKQLHNLAEKYRLMKRYRAKLSRWDLSIGLRLPKELVKKYKFRDDSVAVATAQVFMPDIQTQTMLKKIALLGAAVTMGWALYSGRDYPRHASQDVAQQGFFFEKSDRAVERMIELGHKMRKRLNAGRPAAPGYAAHPYDLRIEIEHTPQGEIAYLVDRADGSKQPIYNGNKTGCTMLELRRGLEEVINGLFERTREGIREMLDAIEPDNGSVGREGR